MNVGDIDYSVVDLEMQELLELWTDWHYFKIKPWKLADEPEGVITYYKKALRHFDRMYQEAEINVNKMHNKGSK